MSIIEISDVTKDYGDNRGIFNLSLTVNKGEIFGYLGPNGAGKSTTIRHLMGFIHADKGTCKIKGYNCYKDSKKIQKFVGYLPGEIAFMDDMKGMEFIKFIADMNGMTDLTRAHELIELFELNPHGKIKRMSKGMKQKIGLVCAFMNDPEILILDEPTSGLDPLMQNKFVDLILEEKKKGKTVLMSSHIFEEIEKTCDRTAIIKEGKLIAVENMKELKSNKKKIYEIVFASEEMTKNFLKENFDSKLINNNTLNVSIKRDLNEFIKTLGNYDVLSLNVKTQTLEDLFLHFYGGENNDK